LRQWEVPGQLISHPAVWQSSISYPGRTRTVDSHASRLRRKLQAAGAPGDPIANVWGAGYRLELPHA
jgi:DNA-binding response OmpR family regulator